MTREERGIALGMAILALVVVGVLVAGVFFAGTQEQRIGENSRHVDNSLAVAEVGAVERLLTLDRAVFSTTPVYPDGWLAVNRTATPGRTGSYSGRVLRLNEDLVFLDISGADRESWQIRGAGAAHQRVGLIARARPLSVNIGASLTTEGDVRMSGNAVVDGSDRAPPGWMDCDPPDTTRVGIRTPRAVRAAWTASVIGDPPIEQESIPDSTLAQFWRSTYDQLAAMADIELLPGTYTTQPRLAAGGVCDLADRVNWGDGMQHNSACGNYFPIIRIQGPGATSTLTGVQGQGILLVDGNLDIHGSYEFLGIAMIRGRLTARAVGASDVRFWGGVLARDADLEGSDLGGGVTVRYSKCLIYHVLRATGVPAPLRSRGWVQLF